MRYFRIGDFAKRMGVSTHLLKHYEEEGVIHPDIRPNGYRFYTLHDSSVLLECRALRNVDFSVHATRELLYSPDNAALSDALTARAAGLRAELVRKQLLLAELERQQALLPRMAACEEEIVETQGRWYLPHVADGTFCEHPETYALLEAWLEWMPVTCSCLRFSLESLWLDRPPQETRCFGMIVCEDAARRCGIPVGMPAEYLPPQRVWRYYMAARAGQQGFDVVLSERACIERIRAAGETPVGELCKTVLFYNAEGEKRMQYALLEVPLA